MRTRFDFGFVTTATPDQWDQTSKNLSALIGVATMRLIGPHFLASYFKRVYDGLGGKPA